MARAMHIAMPMAMPVAMSVGITLVRAKAMLVPVVVAMPMTRLMAMPMAGDANCL